MKKILYISPDFIPTNNAGTVRCLSFIQDLMKNYEVSVITEKCADAFPGLIVRKVLVNKPQNTHGFVKRSFIELLFSLNFALLILFSKKMDLVIISPPPFSLQFLAVLMCRLRRFKYILDIRDVYPDVYFDSGIISSSGKIGRFFSSVEKYTYRYAVAIVTVTDGIVQKIKERSNNDNVHLLRNGFDETKFLPLDEKDKYPTFSVIIHGNLGVFQDIELLNKLAKELYKRNIEVLVIGTGKKESTLDKQYMKYYGEVSYNEIPEIVGKAHVGLSLRTDDIISKQAFPVKVFEYIGLGIPIISTPISEAGYILDKLGMGFQFLNHDIDSIIEVILNLQKSSDDYMRIKNNILKNRDEFCRQKVSKKFLEIIDGLICK